MRKVLFILGDLSDSDIEWLARNGLHREVDEGEVLIREGHDISHVFVVLDGLFAVQAANGQEIAVLQAGEVLGELSFLDSAPPNANVVAVESSRVLAIARTDLAEKLERDADFAAHFYRALGVFLASRLRHTMGRMGFGEPGTPSEEEGVELDLSVLDNASIAAARFEHLLARLRQ
jgi:CRP-like cAMP-binding protein